MCHFRNGHDFLNPQMWPSLGKFRVFQDSGSDNVLIFLCDRSSLAAAKIMADEATTGRRVSTFVINHKGLCCYHSNGSKQTKI
jgi:hypothetical protein